MDILRVIDESCWFAISDGKVCNRQALYLECVEQTLRFSKNLMSLTVASVLTIQDDSVNSVLGF